MAVPVINFVNNTLIWKPMVKYKVNVKLSLGLTKYHAESEWQSKV
jgi:hypothetical protein